MSEAEIREKYTPLIALYVKKVINGEITIDRVPVLIRDVVAKDAEDTESVAQYYAQRVLHNPLNINDVPPTLIERVNELVAEVQNNELNTNLYVAKIINGEITIEDVPGALQENVVREVENAIGKKLV